MRNEVLGTCVLALLVAALPAAAIDPDCRADSPITAGTVDGLDAMLALGGPCPPTGTCHGDVNENGEVGVLDLAVILANLGPCPLIGDVNLDGMVCADDVATVGDNIFTWCPDIDGNGVVDASDDFLVLASLSSDPDDDADDKADINGDGVVDIDDLTIVNDNMGKNCRMDVDFNLEIEVIDGAIMAGLIDPACP